MFWASVMLLFVCTLLAWVVIVSINGEPLEALPEVHGFLITSGVLGVVLLTAMAGMFWASPNQWRLVLLSLITSAIAGLSILFFLLGALISAGAQDFSF